MQDRIFPRLIGRMVQGGLLVAAVCLVNFFLFYLSPGDPVHLYFSPRTDPGRLQTLREQRDLDQPWYVQFERWGGRLIRGDLGYSWSQHRPVRDILAEALPATLQLTLAALFLNILLGCAVGMLSGIYAHRWWGRVLNGAALFLYSVPSFWLALVAILIFSVSLGLFPASQMSSVFADELPFSAYLWDRLRHLVLPATVLGLAGAAATARYVRGQVQEVLRQDYILLARAKGLSAGKVYLHHVLKNALLPVVTLLGLYFPFLLSGAFIIEVIFAWPGMGRVTYEAIFARDYPVIMAVNLLAAVMVLVGNFLADVTYRLVDPRVNIG
ncbi:MAG: ABC transporter permease [Calditrichaeota bacterium]|nr:MAG: ABC transporter permease [Calditrichota bacterium]